MTFRYLAASAAVFAATAPLAHQGVQNQAVKARMDAMTEIAARMKVLGTMAKGATEFDAQTARLAAADIAASAEQTPHLFKAPETDPKSEAAEAIWEEFSTFSQIATDLRQVAETLSTTIDQPEDLRTAMAELGATCKACHQKYRE